MNFFLNSGVINRFHGLDTPLVDRSSRVDFFLDTGGVVCQPLCGPDHPWASRRPPRIHIRWLRAIRFSRRYRFSLAAMALAAIASIPFLREDIVLTQLA